MLERCARAYLEEWAERPGRKPIVVRGARKHNLRAIDVPRHALAWALIANGASLGLGIGSRMLFGWP